MFVCVHACVCRRGYGVRVFLASHAFNCILISLSFLSFVLMHRVKSARDEASSRNKNRDDEDDFDDMSDDDGYDIN